MRFLPALFAVGLAMPALSQPSHAQQPLFAPSAKPVNHGAVGADEGPVWYPERGLYFSGDGGTWLRRLDGKVESVELPGGATNGLLIDRRMRLVACQTGSRRVVRIEADGSLTVLTDNYEGARYNSPNDLAVDSRGRIYFSDPRYGPRDDMEIHDASGRFVEGVYRIDAPGKVVRVLTHEVDRPNGLLISPDDHYLYVADNSNNTVGGARLLLRFDLREDGSVEPASRKVIYDWRGGRGPDGFEMDRAGRLWVAGGRNEPQPPHETIDFPGGVYILSPEGRLLGVLPIPFDEVTNVAFGGEDLKTLYVTAGGTLWSMETSAAGITPWSGR